MNGYRVGDNLVRKLGETFRTVDELSSRRRVVGGDVRRYDDSPPARAAFRIGTFGTASWLVNTDSTVTLTRVGVTGRTVLVTNLFGDLGTASTTRTCAIGRDGTAWFLIQARCP